MSAGVWMLYWTAPDSQSAKVIVKALLEQKLIVCATLTQAESIYEWEGAIEEGRENLVFTKVLAGRVAAVKEFIAQQHPYEIPCILAWPVEANEPYREWAESVSKK